MVIFCQSCNIRQLHVVAFAIGIILFKKLNTKLKLTRSTVVVECFKSNFSNEHPKRSDFSTKIQIDETFYYLLHFLMKSYLFQKQHGENIEQPVY